MRTVLIPTKIKPMLYESNRMFVLLTDEYINLIHDTMKETEDQINDPVNDVARVLSHLSIALQRHLPLAGKEVSATMEYIANNPAIVSGDIEADYLEGRGPVAKYIQRLVKLNAPFQPIGEYSNSERILSELDELFNYRPTHAFLNETGEKQYYAAKDTQTHLEYSGIQKINHEIQTILSFIVSTDFKSFLSIPIKENALQKHNGKFAIICAAENGIYDAKASNYSLSAPFFFMMFTVRNVEFEAIFSIKYDENPIIRLWHRTENTWVYLTHHVFLGMSDAIKQVWKNYIEKNVLENQPVVDLSKINSKLKVLMKTVSEKMLTDSSDQFCADFSIVKNEVDGVEQRHLNFFDTCNAYCVFTEAQDGTNHLKIGLKIREGKIYSLNYKFTEDSFIEPTDDIGYSLSRIFFPYLDTFIDNSIANLTEA